MASPVVEQIKQHMESNSGQVSQCAKTALSLLSEFTAECRRKPCDIVSCSERLTELKRQIGQFPSCCPNPQTIDWCEVMIARETLENAAFLSVKTRDFLAFERNVVQLCAYYQDFAQVSPTTGARHLVLGLYLLHLLAGNRIGEFHMALELISPADWSHHYIQRAVELERHLTDGNFLRIWEAQAQLPDPLYSIFMQTLLVTARQKVGDCLEVSYKSLLPALVQRYLMFDTPEELNFFIDAQNERNKSEEGTGIEWQMKDAHIIFHSIAQPAGEIPAIELLQNTIEYATELERIV